MTAHPTAPQGAPDRGPLKRYDIAPWYDWETSASGLDEIEHPEGDWVRYADLCAEREAEKAELERLREQLAEQSVELAETQGERDTEKAINARRREHSERWFETCKRRTREWKAERARAEAAEARVAELEAQVAEFDEVTECGHASRFTEWSDPTPSGDSDEWCVMCALEEENTARIALLEEKEASPDIWKILPDDGLGLPGMTWKQYAEHLEPGGWQPIETAPRDKSEFLGYDPEQVVEGIRGAVDVTALVVELDDGGAIWGSRGLGRKPTHWMPLPPPPAGEESEEVGQ